MVQTVTSLTNRYDLQQHLGACSPSTKRSAADQTHPFSETDRRYTSARENALSSTRNWQLPHGEVNPEARAYTTLGFCVCLRCVPFPFDVRGNVVRWLASPLGGVGRAKKNLRCGTTLLSGRIDRGQQTLSPQGDVTCVRKPKGHTTKVFNTQTRAHKHRHMRRHTGRRHGRKEDEATGETPVLFTFGSERHFSPLFFSIILRVGWAKRRKRTRKENTKLRCVAVPAALWRGHE